METTSEPSFQSSATPAQEAALRQKRWWLWMLGIAVILIVAGMVIAWATGLLSWNRALPGTLSLRVLGAWTAPSGETVSGLVSYKPAAGTVSSLLGPNLANVIPIAHWPDGISIGIRANASSTELVQVWRQTQNVTDVLAEADAGSLMLYPVRSLDDAQVAYLLLPSLRGLPEADSEGNAYGITLTDSPLLRLDSGLTLPDAYLPQLVIVGSDGTPPRTFGMLRPISFSPDGSALLTVGPDGFILISLVDGSQMSIASLGPIALDSDDLQSTWNGAYVALTDQASGTTQLLSFDWERSTFDVVGAVQDEGSMPVLVNDGSLLLYDFSAEEVTVYHPDADGLSRLGTYSLTLPDGTRIIDWMPQ